MLTFSIELDPEPVNKFQAVGPSCAVALRTFTDLRQVHPRGPSAGIQLRFLTASDVPAAATPARNRR